MICRFKYPNTEMKGPAVQGLALKGLRGRGELGSLGEKRGNKAGNWGKRVEKVGG